MVCSPMYHTVSVRFATGTLLSGGSLAILSRFDAATALDVLRRLRPPRRSWSRPTCSGFCRAPSWRTTRRSTPCASWPTPARPARPR
jgi:hypothetical protein